jgi:hypothetical protein
MFVSFTTQINVNLEEVIGYEKYKITIRNIDKIVEKIALVSNILHLTKGSVNVKSKRKLIVKNTIDLLINNNKILKYGSKERKLNIKEYGINENYTNLFVFPLDNNIFIFSSKDIDKFKPIKQNNIIAYSVFVILLEINNTHLLYMGDGKKLCNFVFFDKVMGSLFGGLKIIINNKGELANITDYKILCYMIYVISCSIATYTKMWYYNYPENEKKNKHIPQVQKIIIHTLVDIINSILEISNDNLDTNYLYNTMSIRFFRKLQDIY